MRRLVGSLAAALVALSSASELQGQDWSVDVRATTAAATQKLAGSDLDTGLGIGGAFVYRINRHLSSYAGWDWLRFHTSESFAGSDVDFEETGYTLGLRFENAFAPYSDFVYRIEAGATYKHVEVENDGGDLIADSGHEPGFEVAGGLAIPLGDVWRLSPTVRFRSLQPAFEVDGVTTNGSLRYAAFDVGVTYRF
jgi:hypothetical protein